MPTQSRTGADKARNLEPTAQRLKGHIAVVTGADSGIGQAIAIAFAKNGADVILNYHKDRAGAEETRHEVEAAGRRCVVRPLDQRDPAAVRRFFEEARAEMGAPTLLINNAGMMGESKPAHELSDEDWDVVLKTDLYGPFYCSREFVKGLLAEEKRGVIVNITSVHEEIVMPEASHYNAAKAGLRSLTRTMAMELAQKGIRVVNLAPGMVLTPMNREAMEDPEVREEREQKIPMKRAAEPEEIARCAVFLASDDASYVNGSTLFADGALMLNVGQGA